MRRLCEGVVWGGVTRRFFDQRRGTKVRIHICLNVMC